MINIFFNTSSTSFQAFLHCLGGFVVVRNVGSALCKWIAMQKDFDCLAIHL